MGDRVLWRDGIRPRTLISEDRGLMARTFGTMYGFAALVALLILFVGESTDRHEWVLVVVSMVTAALSVVFFVGYRRLPTWFFHIALALGSVLIAGAAIGGSTGAEGVYGFGCVWVVVLAFLTLLNVLNFADRYLMAAFGSSIMRDLQLTNFEFTLLTGLVFSFFYVVFGLFAGSLADRYNRRLLLIVTQAAAMTLAFILALLVQFNLTQIWHVYVLATLLGVVTAVDFPALQAFLGDLTGMGQIRKAVVVNASRLLQEALRSDPAAAGEHLSEGCIS